MFISNIPDHMDRMPDNRRFQFHLILTILVMVFIFLQSALPAELSEQESGTIVLLLAGLLHADVDLVSFVVRKAAHFAEYLALGVCLWLTVRDALARRLERMHGSPEDLSESPIPGCTTPQRMPSFFVPWAIGAFYAVTDEIHQYFVPGRSCELRDMLIDACGVAAGVVLCRLISRNARRRSL